VIIVWLAIPVPVIVISGVIVPVTEEAVRTLGPPLVDRTPVKVAVAVAF
jgi:hypothetical protein